MRLLFAIGACMCAVACAPDAPDVGLSNSNLDASVTPAAVDLTGLDNQVAADRQAREVTLRIRALECGGVGVGSAVAVGPRLLATNKHVVEGANELEVQTWDGRAIRVHAIEIAAEQDLALVRVNAELPRQAATAPDAREGEAVSAVGFPGGGPFRRSAGTVVDYVDGTVFEEAGRIMRITAPLRPGNSGGALLNERGELIGVVFAIERATRYGLAIPGSSVAAAVDSARFVPVTANC
jgi:S1-C subfamily serine protease